MPRTSPRLAGYYAARAAAAEQRASAFALVDSVLAFKPAAAAPGKRRSPRLAAAVTPVAEPKPVVAKAKRTSPRLAAVTPSSGEISWRLAGMARDVLRRVFVTGAYGACNPRHEEVWRRWIFKSQNSCLVGNKIDAWIRADPLKARRMGEPEVEEALLEGEIWISVMREMMAV